MSVVQRRGLVNMDEQVRDIERSLAGFAAGERRNVAIVGDPFAGKTALLDAVITRQARPIRNVGLTSTVGEVDDLPATTPGEITAVDDCQYLFQRRIGGFKVLEKFLDAVVSSEGLYITAWNTFAWNYLEQVFALRDYFPVVVTVPALGPEDIAAVIGSRHGLDTVNFTDDGHRDSLLKKIERGAYGLGRTLALGSQDTRRLALEKITGRSHGNPGVALALWQKVYHDGTVRVGDISAQGVEPALGPDEAFVMSNILMTKSASESDLIEVTAGHLRMDRVLYTLRDQGLIRKISGRYGVEPLALYDVVKSLKKSRQVW